MEQIGTRTRPRIPAVTCGGTAKARLDRHLSVLGGPVRSTPETEEAAGLMRDLTARSPEVAGRRRAAGVSLFAPLRRLRRTLFGGRR